MAHTIFRVRVPKSLSIISTDQHATFEVIEAQFSTIKFSQQRVFAPTGFHRVCCLPFTRITHHFSVHIRIRHLLIRLGRSRITVKRRIIDMDGEFTSNIFLIKMKIAQFSSRFFFCCRWYFHHLSLAQKKMKSISNRTANHEAKEGVEWGSYFNQQSDRKKNVERKISKKVTPTKNDEKRKTFRGGGNHFLYFPLLCAFFSYIGSIFFAHSSKAFKGGCYASFYVHPPVATKKTVWGEMKFPLKINSGLRWNEIIGGSKGSRTMFPLLITLP